MGTPNDPSLYTCHDADGIKVCLRNGVHVRNNEFTVRLTKFLFFKEMLYVEGMS